MSMKKLYIVCAACGSHNVTRDGLLRWSVLDQKWEASSELDNSSCDDCGDDCELVETTNPNGIDPEGYTITEDPDQEGKWLWRTASEGCDMSFDTRAEALEAAREHAKGATL